MTDKSLQLEMQMVMEAAEELLTHASYQSDLSSVRVLSVESVEEAHQRELAEQSLNVVTLESHRRPAESTAISKSLKFRDQNFSS